MARKSIFSWHSLQFGVSAVAVMLMWCCGAQGQEMFIFGEDPEGSEMHNGTRWTYDQSGDDWAGKDASNQSWVCLTGQQQSPVNLPTSAAAVTPLDVTHRSIFELGSLTANGNNVRVRNNGHAVEVAWSDSTFAPKVTIVVQENQPLSSNIDLQYGNRISTVTATPRQFHFHTHSEHLLAGKLYPLEAHLVSVVPQSDMPSCPATGCLMVTAVLYELADDITQDNAWLSPFFDIMPYKEAEEAFLPSGSVLDLQQLLPANTSYLAYSGSLTTPPCTEGVLWMVMVNTQKISLKQWRQFRKAVGDYNCTLVPDNASVSSPPTSSRGLKGGRGSGETPARQQDSSSAESNSQGNQQHHMLVAGDDQVAVSQGTSFRLPYVGLHRQLAEAVGSTPPGQHYVCDKLGQGMNARLPQAFNGRVVRLWRETSSSKKSYLPEDAAAAASAGVIAGIVLGTTLGAGLTALIGYVAYKQYQKRRIKRLYNMGISNNDMMMVQQEVESQWLTASPAGGSAPAARASRGGYPV